MPDSEGNEHFPKHKHTAVAAFPSSEKIKPHSLIKTLAIRAARELLDAVCVYRICVPGSGFIELSTSCF